MKNAYIKNILRTIFHNKRRYAAILAIVSLGIAFYVGLRSTSPNMNVTLDRYFDEQNIYDIKILAPLGIDGAMVALIESVPGVTGVMPAYSLDQFVQIRGVSHLVRFHSYCGSGINKPLLIYGRLPENPGECVVDYRSFRMWRGGIGDYIEVSTGDASDIFDEMKFDRYRIVGVVESPKYITDTVGNSAKGRGHVGAFAYILADDFNLKVYTEAYVKTDTFGLSRFSEGYWERIAEIKTALQNALPGAVILDLNANIGFASFKNDSERIDAIALVFPLIFFLVAALVTLTNMLRLVEDDRAAIGTLKSLGYGKAHIFAKYIFYSVSVVVLGSIIGTLTGYRLFPSAIYNQGYRILYRTPPITTLIHWDICIFAFVSALVSVVVPTLSACYGEAASSPANLLRPKSPRPGRRTLLERIPFIWNRLNFFGKVTARNILRYKKRFLMTVAGIAGCTALILTGFGLMDSIKNIAVRQFGEIFLFDGQINLRGGITDGEKSVIESVLAEHNYDYLYVSSRSIRAANNYGSQEVTLTIIRDKARLPDFYSLRSVVRPDRGSAVLIDGSGVILTEKLCLLLNLRVGDTVTLSLSYTHKAEVTVSAIVENYVGNLAYMTPELYLELFGGTEIRYNTILFRKDGNSYETERRLASYLLGLDGVNGLSFNSRTLDFYSNILNSLNFVLVILILAAAALAFIVLFSLTAINIDERLRELATLKVLGFYNNETYYYIFRENIILTLTGTAAGLGLGVALHRYVISTVEVDIIMFAREIMPVSFVYSALLTLLFSVIVNFAMSFGIKKINMAESLKSAE